MAKNDKNQPPSLFDNLDLFATAQPPKPAPAAAPADAPAGEPPPDGALLRAKS